MASDWPYGEGVRRSVALVRGFAVEQTDPAYFYGLLAADSVRLVRRYEPLLQGRLVLDVGAGPVQFAERFRAAGARYVGVDADPSAVHAAGLAGTAALVALGQQLPVATGRVDVAFCSNVFEHVEHPPDLGAELTRVTRPGGLIVVAYTNWLSPWGGHETSPYHYLGGARAASRYERTYGHPPKNLVDRTLFRVSVAAGLRWARTQPGVTLLDASPRYYPRWVKPLVRVPGVREVLTWNLCLVLRRTS